MTWTRDWRLGLRLFLGALWLGNGLEKFGVVWPDWIHGGTGDVLGMLKMMAEDSPIPPVQWLIEGLMLPLGKGLTIPVGILEIVLAVALATGLRLEWSGLLGALIQSFFWAGFMTVDWPFQYPVLILAHLALSLPFLLKDRPLGSPAFWIRSFMVCLALLWIYEGLKGNLSSLLPAALCAASLVSGVRWAWIAGIAGMFMGLVMTGLAFSRESWGTFVWAYYAVAAVQVATLVWHRADSSAAKSV